MNEALYLIPGWFIQADLEAILESFRSNSADPPLQSRSKRLESRSLNSYIPMTLVSNAWFPRTCFIMFRCLVEPVMHLINDSFQSKVLSNKLKLMEFYDAIHITWQYYTKQFSFLLARFLLLSFFLCLKEDMYVCYLSVSYLDKVGVKLSEYPEAVS